MTETPSVERTKSLQVSPAPDGSFTFTTRLTDRSWRGHYEHGDNSALIHDFTVIGAVGADLVVTRLEVDAVEHPYDLCPAILPACGLLVGASLGTGWRKAVLGNMAGRRGCTHVTTLLLGLTEVSTMVFFLRINERLRFGPAARADGSWMAAGYDLVPSLDGACHVLQGRRPPSAAGAESAS